MQFQLGVKGQRAIIREQVMLVSCLKLMSMQMFLSCHINVLE